MYPSLAISLTYEFLFGERVSLTPYGVRKKMMGTASSVFGARITVFNRTPSRMGISTSRLENSSVSERWAKTTGPTMHPRKSKRGRCILQVIADNLERKVEN